MVGYCSLLLLCYNGKIIVIACLTCFCFSLPLELSSFTSVSSLYYPKLYFMLYPKLFLIFSSLTLSSDYSRHGYDYYGGYERGIGGRGGYADEKSYGRFGPRSSGGYQNGISGMSVVANKYLDFSYIP